MPQKINSKDSKSSGLCAALFALQIKALNGDFIAEMVRSMKKYRLGF